MDNIEMLILEAEQTRDLANPKPLDPELVEWLANPRNFGPDAEFEGVYFEY